MDLRSEAIKGFKWSFLIQFGYQILRFIVSIILARILMPREFGVIGMISIFIVIGRILVEGGLATSLIRTKDPDDADYSTVFYINLAVSIFIYILLYISAPTIARFFNEDILKNITRVLCLTFIVGAFSTVQSTRLNKNLQFKTQFLLQMPSLILSGCIAIWMAYNGYGVWSLVFHELSKRTIETILLWIYSKWTPARIFDWEKFKYHINFGYKLGLSKIISTISDNIYSIIIGKYFSAVQLGYFNRAKTFNDLPSVNIAMLFERVSFPLLSQVKEDDRRLKSIYRKLMMQVIFWVAPVLIITGVLATPLFRFLLTDKWLPAVPYFRILLIAGILYPLHRYNLNICYIKDRSSMVLKLSLLQSILAICGAITAIWLGIYGLLWSIVIVNLIVTIVNAYYSGGLINYSLLDQIKDIGPIILTGLFSGLIALIIDHFFILSGQGDLFRLIITFLISFSTYFGISLLLKIQAIIEVKAEVLPKIYKFWNRILKKG